MAAMRLDASPKVPNSHVNGISIDSNYSTILFQNFSNLILRTHKQPFYLLQGEINTNFAVKMRKRYRDSDSHGHLNFRLCTSKMVMGLFG